NNITLISEPLFLDASVTIIPPLIPLMILFLLGKFTFSRYI
ncbi:hypothetical protein Q604_UNBC13566G0002, partial [human gut metagenome]